jgi:hypothetical protein
MENLKLILVIGGTGAQGSPVVNGEPLTHESLGKTTPF